MSNHLAHETSPYLLQHADNPVDWRPWNTEILQIAREQTAERFSQTIALRPARFSRLAAEYCQSLFKKNVMSLQTNHRN
jgi:hypothetical protein